MPKLSSHALPVIGLEICRGSGTRKSSEQGDLTDAE
jgi:hypothetical protein